MKKTTLINGILALSLLSLASCGGKAEEASSQPSSSSETSEASSKEAILTLIIITPEKTTLEVGEEEALQVRVEGGDEEGYNVNWYSSNTSVLSVTQSGKIIALKEGTSEVTAQYKNFVSSPLLITVSPKKVPSVTLPTPETSSIEVGQTLQLSATTKDAEGLTLSYFADNDNVSVTSSGLVTGLKEGTSKIKAALNNEIFSNEIEITILPQSKDLTVSLKQPSNEILLKGNALALESEVKGNVNNYPLVYSSSDASIATVSEKGVVIGVKQGEVTITLSVGEVSSSVSLKVIDAYDEVESISYSSSSLTLALGEPFAFEGVSILPKTADQAFTIESSAPLYVSVDGNEITGRKVTDSEVSVLLKAGSKSFEVKVTVVTSKALHTQEVLAKLKKAAEVEINDAKIGHFYKIDKKADGSEKGTYEKFDFEVYGDGKTTATYDKVSSYSSKKRLTWAQLGSHVYKATDTLNEDDSVASSFYSSYDIVPDAQSASPGTSYHQTDVDKALQLPIVSDEVNPTRLGFANMVINTYFSSSAHTYFGENSLESNVKTFTYSRVGDVYTLGIDSMATTYSNSKEHIELTLGFDGDNLKQIGGSIASYSGESDYDDDSKTAWTLTGTTVLDGVLETGERQNSPASSFSPEAHCATSFDIEFSTGYGTNKKVGTSFAPGETISYSLTNLLPEDYSNVIDPMSIAFPGHEDLIKRSTYGYSFTVSSSVDDLEVVVSTYKVSKTYHLKIASQATVSLSLSLPSAGLVNEETSGSVAFDKNSAVSLSYEVTSANADKATVTPGTVTLSSGKAKFTIKAAEEGTYSIKVTDANSGLSKSQDIIVKGTSDSDLASYIVTNSWSGGSGTPSLSLNEDGSITLKAKIVCYDEYDDSETVNLTVVFKVEDGKLTLVSSSNGGSSSELKATALSFKGTTHSSISVTLSINDDWVQPYLTLTVK